MKSVLLRVLIRSVFLFALSFAFLPIISSCSGGGNGGGGIGAGIGGPVGGEASPAAPTVTNTASDNSNPITVASATPSTPQPTYPSIPHESYIIQMQLLLPGTDPSSTCEKGFENYPTIQVWSKENGSWKKDHELQKPDADWTDKAKRDYLCGNFITLYPWLISAPNDDPCFIPYEGKFVAIYKNSNGLTFKGESEHIYTCHDRDQYPLARIYLEPPSPPSNLMRAPLPAEINTFINP